MLLGLCINFSNYWNIVKSIMYINNKVALFSSLLMMCSRVSWCCFFSCVVYCSRFGYKTQCNVMIKKTEFNTSNCKLYSICNFLLHTINNKPSSFLGRLSHYSDVYLLIFNLLAAWLSCYNVWFQLWCWFVGLVNKAYSFWW